MSNQRPMIRIAGIVPESVTDGPGVRFTIFTQGCPHDCPGCHNPHTHDPNGGYEIAIDEILDQIQRNPLLGGITFSGGEPFLQSANLAKIARICHKWNLTVTTYTGYLYEDIIASDNTDWQTLLRETDLLVDGPFVQELATTTLPFRGSSNQRVIAVNGKNENMKAS